MLQKITENHSALLQENQNCQALWKAVILQALLDLKSISKKKIAKCNRNQADKWMNLHNKDFLRVCGLADLDPEYVISRKKRIIVERDSKLKSITQQAEQNAKNNTQENTSDKDNKKANQEIQGVA